MTKAPVQGAHADAEPCRQLGNRDLGGDVSLNPQLGFDHHLVGERCEAAVHIAVFLVGAANLVGEIALHMLGSGAVESALDEMHRDVRQGIDAGRAIKRAGLGDEELALELDRRIIALEALEVVPVGGRGASIEQAGIGQQTDAGTDRRNLRAAFVLLDEPRTERRKAATQGRGIAPQGGQIDHVETTGIGQLAVGADCEAPIVVLLGERGYQAQFDMAIGTALGQTPVGRRQPHFIGQRGAGGEHARGQDEADAQTRGAGTIAHGSCGTMCRIWPSI